MNLDLAKRAAAVTILLALIPALEGRRNIPYPDVVNVETVCDGHTGNIENRPYSDAECDDLLKQDLTTSLDAVGRCTQVDLTPKTIAALASFTFNVGADAFCKSTLAKKINAGYGAKACYEMDRWVYAGHRVIKGLKRRRDVERALCIEGFQT